MRCQPGDMMGWMEFYAPLLLRVLLVVLFPFSAMDKVVNWRAALQQAGGVPLAPVLVGFAVVVELVAPVCIVTGWHDRAAAFVLGGFCAVTAVLYHQFWRYPDFWRFRPGAGLTHFWDFLKNFGLVGGLGLIVLSPRTVPVSVALRAPFVSSHVMGAQAGSPLSSSSR